MHGFTNCRSGAMPWSPTLYLDEVLDDCYAFLGQHPTEFIVFAVKQEHGDESVADFERLLDSYVQKKPEYWLLTDSIPTVGEARGKLVLMRRYEDEAGLGSAAGIPLLWENQNGFDNPALNTVSEDNGAYVLWVQDRYEYETADKWKAFTAGMEAAQKEENDLAIHFLSTKGTAKFGHPYRYAGPLNQKLMDRDALSGWIIVDFASAPIAEHIYQMNFR